MFRFNNKEIADALDFIHSHPHMTMFIKGIFNLYLFKSIENNNIRSLTDSEKEKANNFYISHKNCCMEKLGKPFFSSTGGGFEYIIDWTLLGPIFTYKCNTCNESIDITDYSILQEKYDELKEYTDGRSFGELLSIKPFSFIICGTGLGNCITIVDNYTHDSKDITDSDSW